MMPYAHSCKRWGCFSFGMVWAIRLPVLMGGQGGGSNRCSVFLTANIFGNPLVTPMKAVFYAINLLLGLLLPAITLGQTPEAVPTFTAEQIIPLLKRYDLEGVGKLVGKGELISGKEVNIDLGYDFMKRLPFTRMFVADDCLRLRATDRLLFTYCPLPRQPLKSWWLRRAWMKL